MRGQFLRGQRDASGCRSVSQWFFAYRNEVHGPFERSLVSHRIGWYPLVPSVGLARRAQLSRPTIYNRLSTGGGPGLTSTVLAPLDTSFRGNYRGLSRNSRRGRVSLRCSSLLVTSADRIVISNCNFIAIKGAPCLRHSTNERILFQEFIPEKNHAAN